ncbi:MAG: hypothetical protein U1E06_14765 [Tabrizicola sp.]|uniref:hypothetical protein n=1 Tax=Tabrizicola sp. TaxID=2005166 RepID=UPI00273531EE|nr:hypothetical protein [Tabrizicola sp.]MDP3265025.1 hypothetical protein [Tabrizicola sp.]MDP3647432.1 hypothetical protein [Paracoccaceae bacterium]MDZ4068086.1 hypothetical protein [Tabrizicola sp.]
MSDQRQSTPPQSGEKSNGAIIFIVGGLVVAVAVLGYVFTDGFGGGSMPGATSDAPAISIENNATAPAAAPAPAEPAPAPAETAPAAPAPAAPEPAPAAPANP